MTMYVANVEFKAIRFRCGAVQLATTRLHNLLLHLTGIDSNDAVQYHRLANLCDVHMDRSLILWIFFKRFGQLAARHFAPKARPTDTRVTIRHGTWKGWEVLLAAGDSGKTVL